MNILRLPLVAFWIASFGTYSDNKPFLTNLNKISPQIERVAFTPEKLVQTQKAEAEQLEKEGELKRKQRQFDAALTFFHQAISLCQTLNDFVGESRITQKIGLVYQDQEKYSKALQYYQTALKISTQARDQNSEIEALMSIGAVYADMGRYPKSLEAYETVLQIQKQRKNRQGEANALGNIGLAYDAIGDYTQALNYYNTTLEIIRENSDRNAQLEQGVLLNNIGLVYARLGQYSKSLELLQKALDRHRATQYLRGEGQTLSNFGLVYDTLGEYQKAIQFFQEALVFRRAISDLRGQATTLNSMGLSYAHLGNNQKALEVFKQALTIRRSIGDHRGEGITLNNTGLSFTNLKQYSRALDYYNQALTIARTINHRRGEATTLFNIGVTYRLLGDYSKALDVYQQSLATRREISDLDGEGRTLSEIGLIYDKREQPELAVVFYKQSVSVTETIRQYLRTLSRDEQAAYTETIAQTYRRLASLLLNQGRILEAQQVLELLKIQELRDYTRESRAGSETQSAPLNAIEDPVITPFNTLIALGIKLTTCERQKPYCSERDQLLSQRNQATEQFSQQANRLRTLARQGRDKDPAQLRQEELTVAAYKIVQAQPNTILIYPLVLDNKLWLVYGLQAGKQGVVFASKEIFVSRTDLSTTVTQFRQLLEKPGSDIKQLQQVSQKLYGWLIAPLRPQLDASGIQNLVFSLDRSTRYIPVAALYDGNQYLAQRFSLSTILTAGLTDTLDKLSPNLSDNPILGLGLSNTAAGFPALPNVANELNAIIRTSRPDSKGIFQGTERLNGDFNLNAFKDILNYRILHIATHGKFDSGDPEKSFLVLGDGNLLKVTDIKNMNDLGGIHLVVLSACETAQGGPDKEGIEVSGLSYYFLTQNAKSVLASLWKVNDASTSQLMQQFYKNLATGKMSKVEALRQAQRSMIHSNGTGSEGDRGSFKIETTSDDKTSITTRNLSHPYYWAPFILIGNGL